ncbi:Sodium/calcium exchanger protein-domain-containing protein [Dipodascopsis uninucleata]
MDHSSRRTSRAFSTEDAEQEVELDRDNTGLSGSHRPSSTRRRSRQRNYERPPLAEVHFIDDPSLGATSTPLAESHIHVHHHNGVSRGGSSTDVHENEISVEDIATNQDEDDEVEGNDSGDTLHNTDHDEEFVDSDDTASIESFTLRERQDAINETHPFGIRIWKPALYKKSRSVQRIAEGDIHSAPGKKVSWIVWVGNYTWSILFGFPLWLIIMTAASFSLGLFFWSPSAVEYGRAFYGLANYLLFPFGKFVQLDQDEQYALEDEGEGHSLGEYEEWRTGTDRGRLFFGPSSRRNRVVVSTKHTNSSGVLEAISETDGLLDRSGNPNDDSISVNIGPDSLPECSSSSTDASASSLENGIPFPNKRRLFGRGQWNLGRVIFYLWFYLVIFPAMFFVSAVAWFIVFSIPMARVNVHLCSHLRRHPLALSYHKDGPLTRNMQESSKNSTVLLCTYRAFGWNYYKYTVDGTNVFLMNLMFIVVFTIFDQYLISKVLGPNAFFAKPGAIFFLALCSVIPLAYFIGQAVASISAQSSMGMGAAINAFFSTIVEVFLYCVALMEGKGRLVEGSVVGSILAGVLVMPGISMCSGAIKRKTQRYNPKSAGVNSTMLLFAIIGAFAPTLFYQIYGSYQLFCVPCKAGSAVDPIFEGTCRKCQFYLSPLTNDDFYRSAVRPFSYICAILLFVSYVIGLWFTLRTHAAMIWQASGVPASAPVGPSTGQAEGTNTASQSIAVNEPLYEDYGSSQSNINVYSFKFKLPVIGSQQRPEEQALPLIDLQTSNDTGAIIDTTVNPRAGQFVTSSQNATKISSDKRSTTSQSSDKANSTGANFAAQSPSTNGTASRRSLRSLLRSRQNSTKSKISDVGITVSNEVNNSAVVGGDDNEVQQDATTAQGDGGHDAPNWSRFKSYIILLGATILYAVIAEILVDTVDTVLDNVSIDEKFLGITLFALVPNTTEFLNAISFAMNGNIALSMEIGSAYVLQVCLLQIPALVFFSVWSVVNHDNLRDYTFSLVFPRWDLVVVVLCVFLLSYIYAEGRSNYFKGSILLLSYFVVMAGFWFSGTTGEAQLSSIPSNGSPVMEIPGYQLFV